MSPFGYVFESPMLVNSSVVAGPQGSGIHEANAGCITQVLEFWKKHEGNNNTDLKVDETVIRNQPMENIFNMGADEVLVVAFEV